MEAPRTAACAVRWALVGSLGAPQLEAVRAVVRASLFSRRGISGGGRCGTTGRAVLSSCSTRGSEARSPGSWGALLARGACQPARIKEGGMASSSYRRRYGRTECRSATASFLGHELSEGRSTSCALSIWVDAPWRGCARSMSESYGIYRSGERVRALSAPAWSESLFCILWRPLYNRERDGHRLCRNTIEVDPPHVPG